MNASTFAQTYADAVEAITAGHEADALRLLAEARVIALQLDSEAGEAVMLPVVERAEVLSRLIFAEVTTFQ